MNRKVLLLNLALLGLAGLLLWQLRVRRQQAQVHERAVLLKGGVGQTVLAPPPPAPVPPVVPAEYNDSVQRMLFSKDRNPNVIVDPPPPPKPAPPPPVMPALPHYYGQIHFGDPAVFLSPATSNEQKAYGAGEKIGEFKVVAFDSESITFDWNGQQVVRRVSDLKPKDAQPPQQPVAAAAPQPQRPPAQASSVVAIGGDSSSGSSASSIPSIIGPDMGGGYYGCQPGDATPSGATVSGYVKTSSQTPFGVTCRWEKSK